MGGWPFFQPRDLPALSDGELNDYEDACGQRLEDLALKHERITGRLEGLSIGLKKKKILLGVGTAVGALGMIGLAVFTWGGAVGLAGGAIAVLGLDDFSSDARERAFLRIDLRNLNETILFCRGELERIGSERQRRRASRP